MGKRDYNLATLGYALIAPFSKEAARSLAWEKAKLAVERGDGAPFLALMRQFGWGDQAHKQRSFTVRDPALLRRSKIFAEGALGSNHRLQASSLLDFAIACDRPAWALPIIQGAGGKLDGYLRMGHVYLLQAVGSESLRVAVALVDADPLRLLAQDPAKPSTRPQTCPTTEAVRLGAFKIAAELALRLAALGQDRPSHLDQVVQSLSSARDAFEHDALSPERARHGPERDAAQKAVTEALALALRAQKERAPVDNGPTGTAMPAPSPDMGPSTQASPLQRVASLEPSLSESLPSPKKPESTSPSAHEQPLERPSPSRTRPLGRG